MDGAIAEMVGASAGCDEVITNGIYMNVATIQICEVLGESMFCYQAFNQKNESKLNVISPELVEFTIHQIINKQWTN